MLGFQASQAAPANCYHVALEWRAFNEHLFAHHCLVPGMTFVCHMKICSQEVLQGKFYVAKGRSLNKALLFLSYWAHWLAAFPGGEPGGLKVCLTFPFYKGEPEPQRGQMIFPKLHSQLFKSLKVNELQYVCSLQPTVICIDVYYYYSCWGHLETLHPNCKTNQHELEIPIFPIPPPTPNSTRTIRFCYCYSSDHAPCPMSFTGTS